MNTSVLKASLLGVMIALGAGAVTVGYFGFAPLENTLSKGPHIPGPYGPLSASDGNRDSQVTRAEMENLYPRGLSGGSVWSPFLISMIPTPTAP